MEGKVLSSPQRGTLLSPALSFHAEGKSDPYLRYPFYAVFHAPVRIPVLFLRISVVRSLYINITYMLSYWIKASLASDGDANDTFFTAISSSCSPAEICTIVESNHMLIF